METMGIVNAKTNLEGGSISVLEPALDHGVAHEAGVYDVLEYHSSFNFTPNCHHSVYWICYELDYMR